MTESLLSVVGGVYIEQCAHPLWNAVYGSGGRASAAVAGLVDRVRLHTYVPESILDEARALAGRSGFELAPVEHTSRPIIFDYLHSLATPAISPRRDKIRQHPTQNVSADVVLRFGMMEGDAVVTAAVAVYDPQSAVGAVSFSQNSSQADRLAYILNENEAKTITGESDHQLAIRRLHEDHGAEVVVLKMGSKGAIVSEADGTITPVHSYRSDFVWKIGSGDVFSAAFAALWGVHTLKPVEAADLASRATSDYCSTRSLPISDLHGLREPHRVAAKPGSGLVYLAGPFFDLGQRWLIEESRDALLALGVEVFSPLHDVGRGPAETVAPQDLRGLDQSSVVLAIVNGLDAGTIFEVGYAISAGKKVVAFAQSVSPEDLKMLDGSGCTIVDDFATAIYRTVWALP